MLARRGKRRDREGAKTAMLEIMVMLSVMAAAVASVVSFESSTTSFEASQEDLQDAAEHFLAILEDTPQASTSRCDGTTWLDQVAVEALAGEKDFLRDHASGRLSNTQLNMILDNGRGKYPLFEEFKGYSNAGASIGFDPDTSWSLPVPQVSGVSGQEALVIDIPALRNGELFRMAGEAIELTIDTTTTYNAVSRSVHANGATALPRHDYERGSAGDLVWVDGDLVPTLVREPSLAEINPLGQEEMLFNLLIYPADASIPAGTTVEVGLPAGWKEPENMLPTLWIMSSSGDDLQGWHLRFELVEDTESARTMSFSALAPLAATKPFDLVHARLGNGSLGQSSFVVQYPTPLDLDLPLQAYLTTPYPLTRGEDAVFGVVFANGGAATKVTHVEIEIPGGYDLWHNNGEGAELFEPETASVFPVPLEDSTYQSGTWRVVDSRHLQWTGSRDVPASTAVDWFVKVRITDDPDEHTAFEEPASDGVVSRLALDNDFDATSITLGPNVGVLRQRIVPDAVTTTASDGYPWAVSTEPVEHEYLVRVEDGGYHVDATGTYTVVPDSSDLVQMDSALANSTTRVEERLVPLGGVLRVETNVESMVTDLSANGVASSTLTVDIYAPFSRGCAPTATWTRDSSAMPLAAINALDVYDELGVGAPSTYLAAADGNVYRVDSTGALVWSRETTAEPVAIDAGATGALTNAVFVGEANGNITKIDITLGEIVWSKRMGGTPMPIDILRVNATSGRVLAATAETIEVRSASDGTVLGVYEDHDSTGSFYSAEWIHDGGVAFASTSRFGSVDASLIDPLIVEQPETIGLSVTEIGLIVTHGRSTSAYDIDTLEPIADVAVSHGDVPSFTASGDATGDGVPDHLVARPDLEVVIVDGRTGESTEHVPAVFEPSSYGASIDPFGILDNEMYWEGDGIRMETYEPVAFQACDPGNGVFPNLQETAVCVEVEDPNNLVPRPLMLRAEGGSVLYAYTLGALPRIYGWTPSDGVAFVDEFVSVEGLPSDLWVGPWSALTRGYGWGDIKGFATMRPETPTPSTGGAFWSATPTEFVGQFVFNVGIPLGGFYGAHIVKMTLAWESPTGDAREAHLLDWFHVVDVDGTPVAAPQYRIELNVRDPFMPMDAS